MTSQPAQPKRVRYEIPLTFLIGFLLLTALNFWASDVDPVLGALVAFVAALVALGAMLTMLMCLRQVTRELRRDRARRRMAMTRALRHRASRE